MRRAFVRSPVVAGSGMLAVLLLLLSGTTAARATSLDKDSHPGSSAGYPSAARHLLSPWRLSLEQHDDLPMAVRADSLLPAGGQHSAAGTSERVQNCLCSVGSSRPKIRTKIDVFVGGVCVALDSLVALF